MKQVFLKKGHTKRIDEGHLWVFSNELTEVPKFESGTIVEVIGSRRNYGAAFYNPNSLIACRLLKTISEPDYNFFKNRISDALNFRKINLPDENSYRLVFGESDLLPGLIIDKFEDYFVVQIQSFGFELRKDWVIKSLLELFPQTKGILFKGNSKLRQIEGLSETDEILFGSIPEKIKIDDKSIKLEISLTEGQKTGYYLDQRLNRHYVRSISNGKTVLDCYCNTGGFGLNALKGGAESVTFIDSSEAAISDVKRNLGINFYKNSQQYCDDAFSILPKLFSEGRKFDIVILDPPAFAKNKKNIYTAIAGYSKLNRLGIELVSKNGYLVTSSCSHHISEYDFFEIIRNEAAKNNKVARLIHKSSQPPDHPVLMSMPETNYLKFMVISLSEF